MDCLYQPDELVSELKVVNNVTGTSIMFSILLGSKITLIVSWPIIRDGFISKPKLLVISVFKINLIEVIDGRNSAIFCAVVSEIIPFGEDMKLSVNSSYVTPRESRIDFSSWIFIDMFEAILSPML